MRGAGTAMQDDDGETTANILADDAVPRAVTAKVDRPFRDGYGSEAAGVASSRDFEIHVSSASLRAKVAEIRLVFETVAIEPATPVALFTFPSAFFLMRGSDADAVASRLVATTTTHFEGFPAAGLPFLRDLARNNERAWFLERKDVYHERVEEPMRALIADVAAGCAAAKLGFAPNPAQPMFRIYRDVRFSKDKSPYKTAAASAFYPDGDKTRPGVLYIHIDPKAPFIASGFYHPERDALVAIRAAIAASNEFDKCIAALEKRAYALGTDDTLARLPREYADRAGTRSEPYLKLKSFIVSKQLDPKTLRDPDLGKTIVAFAKDAAPLARFGWKALGLA